MSSEYENPNVPEIDDTPSIRVHIAELVLIANARVLPARRVPLTAALTVADRVLARTPHTDASARAFAVERAVDRFITLATLGLRTNEKAEHFDLLPISHPLSTARSGLTASAIAEARAEWLSADPRIAEELRPLVASIQTMEFGSIERMHALARLEAAGRDIPLDLVALIADGNSSAARSARAKRQLRDRLKRFAFEGHMGSFLVRFGSKVKSQLGVLVGGSSTTNTGELYITEDDAPLGLKKGDILPVNLDNFESLGVVLTTDQLKRAGIELPAGKASTVKRAQDIKDLLANKLEAPSDWKKLPNGDFATEDGFIATPKGDLKYELKDSNGNVVEGLEAAEWPAIQAHIKKVADDEFGSGTEQPAEAEAATYLKKDLRVDQLYTGDLLPDYYPIKGAEENMLKKREADPSYELPPTEEILGIYKGKAPGKYGIKIRNLKTGKERYFEVNKTARIYDVRQKQLPKAEVKPAAESTSTAPSVPGSLDNLGIDFQSATMDASGTRLPTPGAFTGEFQNIMQGAQSWKDVQDRLQGQTVTYFDFETTGIADYDGQDITNDSVQLGAVKVKDGKIVGRFNVYTNPESKLSDWSAKNLGRDILDENGNRVLDENGKPKTTLVTPEWLAQQKSKDDAIKEFIAFIGPNALLGGQNVPFDVEILKRMADDAGVKLDIAGTIDSKDLASLLPKYDPQTGTDGPKAPDRKTGEIKATTSLGPVANFLGFEPANWHSADGDAEDAYNLVSRIIDRAAKEDNKDLSLLDFPAMKKRYEERMAEFKSVVSPSNPTTDNQKKALEEFSNSANPEIAAKAKDALASAKTRGEAASVLQELHAADSKAAPQGETLVDKTGPEIKVGDVVVFPDGSRRTVAKKFSMDTGDRITFEDKKTTVLDEPNTLKVVSTSTPTASPEPSTIEKPKPVAVPKNKPSMKQKEMIRSMLLERVMTAEERQGYMNRLASIDKFDVNNLFNELKVLPKAKVALTDGSDPLNQHENPELAKIKQKLAPFDLNGSIRRYIDQKTANGGEISSQEIRDLLKGNKDWEGTSSPYSDYSQEGTSLNSALNAHKTEGEVQSSADAKAKSEEAAKALSDKLDALKQGQASVTPLSKEEHQSALDNLVSLISDSNDPENTVRSGILDGTLRNGDDIIAALNKQQIKNEYKNLVPTGFATGYKYISADESQKPEEWAIINAAYNLPAAPEGFEPQFIANALKGYDNESGDLSKLINSGASSKEIFDWLRTKSPGHWNSREGEYNTSWAVDFPTASDKARWKKFGELKNSITALDKNETPTETQPDVEFLSGVSEKLPENTISSLDEQLGKAFNGDSLSELVSKAENEEDLQRVVDEISAVRAAKDTTPQQEAQLAQVQDAVIKKFYENHPELENTMAEPANIVVPAEAPAALAADWQPDKYSGLTAIDPETGYTLRAIHSKNSSNNGGVGSKVDHVTARLLDENGKVIAEKYFGSGHDISDGKAAAEQLLADMKARTPGTPDKNYAAIITDGSDIKSGELVHWTTPENAKSIIENGFNPDGKDTLGGSQWGIPGAMFVAEYGYGMSEYMASEYWATHPDAKEIAKLKVQIPPFEYSRQLNIVYKNDKKELETKAGLAATAASGAFDYIQKKREEEKASGSGMAEPVEHLIAQWAAQSGNYSAVSFPNGETVIFNRNQKDVTPETEAEVIADEKQAETPGPESVPAELEKPSKPLGTKVYTLDYGFGPNEITVDGDTMYGAARLVKAAYDLPEAKGLKKIDVDFLRGQIGQAMTNLEQKGDFKKAADNVRGAIANVREYAGKLKDEDAKAKIFEALDSAQKVYDKAYSEKKLSDVPTPFNKKGPNGEVLDKPVQEIAPAEPATQPEQSTDVVENPFSTDNSDKLLAEAKTNRKEIDSLDSAIATAIETAGVNYTPMLQGVTGNEHVVKNILDDLDASDGANSIALSSSLYELQQALTDAGVAPLVTEHVMEIANAMDGFVPAEGGDKNNVVTVDTIKEEQAGSLDLSKWKKVGGQKGSNPGGTYENPETGEQVYVKTPKSELHGENERLASAIYDAAGISSAKVLAGKDANGNDVTYSPMIDGAKQDLKKNLNNKEYMARLQQGFAIDALLANWDVIGLDYDNVVTDKNGEPVRVDPGGALLFRAQGSPKGGAFGEDVPELDAFTDKTSTRPSAKVFSQMTDEQKLESAKVLQNLSTSQIDELVDSIITDPVKQEELKTKLKARRQYILDKFGLSDKPAKKKNPAAGSSGKTKKLDVNGDNDSLKTQLEDAAKNGDLVSFKYNDKERVVAPTYVWTNPKNGNINLTGEEDGVSKNYTLQNFKPSEVDLPEQAPNEDDFGAKVQEATGDIMDLRESFDETNTFDLDSADAQDVKSGKIVLSNAEKSMAKAQESLAAGDADGARKLTEQAVNELTSAADYFENIMGQSDGGKAIRKYGKDTRDVAAKVQENVLGKEVDASSSPEAPATSTITGDALKKIVDNAYEKYDPGVAQHSWDSKGIGESIMSHLGEIADDIKSGKDLDANESAKKLRQLAAMYNELVDAVTSTEGEDGAEWSTKDSSIQDLIEGAKELESQADLISPKGGTTTTPAASEPAPEVSGVLDLADEKIRTEAAQSIQSQLPDGFTASPEKGAGNTGFIMVKNEQDETVAMVTMDSDDPNKYAVQNFKAGWKIESADSLAEATDKLVNATKVVKEPGQVVQLSDGSTGKLGAKVVHSKNGITGTIVGFQKDPNYVKVKPDGGGVIKIMSINQIKSNGSGGEPVSPTPAPNAPKAPSAETFIPQKSENMTMFSKSDGSLSKVIVVKNNNGTWDVVYDLNGPDFSQIHMDIEDRDEAESEALTALETNNFEPSTPEVKAEPAKPSGPKKFTFDFMTLPDVTDAPEIQPITDPTNPDKDSIKTDSAGTLIKPGAIVKDENGRVGVYRNPGYGDPNKMRMIWEDGSQDSVAPDTVTATGKYLTPGIAAAYAGVADLDFEKNSEPMLPVTGPALEDKNGKKIGFRNLVVDKNGDVGVVVENYSSDGYIKVAYPDGMKKRKANTLTALDTKYKKNIYNIQVAQKYFKNLDADKYNLPTFGATAKSGTSKKAPSGKLSVPKNGAGAKPQQIDQLGWDKSGFEGAPSLQELLTKVSTPGSGLAGGSIALDADAVEDLDLRIIAATGTDGSDAYLLKYKLTSWAGDELANKLLDMIQNNDPRVSATTGLSVPENLVDGDKVSFVPSLSGKSAKYKSGYGQTFIISLDDGTKIHFLRADVPTKHTSGSAKISSNAPRAYHNKVMIIAPKKDSTPESLALALNTAGVQDVRPSTKEDAKILIENRLMSILDEKVDPKSNPSGSERAASLQRIKDTWGITPENVTITTGAGGRIEMRLDPESAKKIASKTGIKVLRHTLRSSYAMQGPQQGETEEQARDRVAQYFVDRVSTPQGGLLSTTVRWSEGIPTSGQSSSRDIETGGADYVFTTPKFGTDSENSSLLPGLWFDAERTFQRLDFWANKGDQFGKRVGKSPIDQAVPGGYEVMFKGRLSFDDAAVLMVKDEDMRTRVITKLRQKGITQLGGRPLEAVVMTGPDYKAAKNTTK